MIENPKKAPSRPLYLDEKSGKPTRYNVYREDLREAINGSRDLQQMAAQFSDDPERILPEPGPLESAKSYREKKAKPLLAKIVKVLRSLYRAYVELKGISLREAAEACGVPGSSFYDAALCVEGLWDARRHNKN